MTNTYNPGFYINLPIGGVVAIFLLLSRIPDQIKKPNPRTILPQLHRKLDLVGFVLFAPAPIQLLLALQYGGQAYPWKSATVIGLFCGSAANFVVWGLWNYHKGDAALIPFSTAKKQAVWTSTVTQMLLFSNLLTLSYFIPIYFQTVKGASPVKGGVYFLPSILSQLVAAVLSGFLGKLPSSELIPRPANLQVQSEKWDMPFPGLWPRVSLVPSAVVCFLV